MLTLPETVPSWQLLLDTAAPDAEPAPAPGASEIAAHSVRVYTRA